MRISINVKSLILYIAVLAASLVLASFYGGPLVFAWLYAILLMLPLSGAYIFLNYRYLRIFQEIDLHRVSKNEDHRYRAIIENAGILPIHRMRLGTFSDRCDLYEISDGQEISLGTLEKKELVSGISCKYAGSYNIGIETVGFTDPFSIFRALCIVPYTFRAVVSPPITDIADRVLDLENLVNSTGLKSNRLYETIPGSDMRPYRAGDPMHSINWKVSARLSELVTRVPDKMEKRAVTIVAQAARVPDNSQDLESLKKRDYFLEFIVSAAWHFAHQNLPVRLIYPAGKVSESVVDSHRSFMDFYSIAADGIFYNSEEEFKKIQDMAEDQRSGAHENGTWIFIKEDPEPGESHFAVCD